MKDEADNPPASCIRIFRLFENIKTMSAVSTVSRKFLSLQATCGCAKPPIFASYVYYAVVWSYSISRKIVDEKQTYEYQKLVIKRQNSVRILLYPVSVRWSDT